MAAPVEPGVSAKSNPRAEDEFDDENDEDEYVRPEEEAFSALTRPRKTGTKKGKKGAKTPAQAAKPNDAERVSVRPALSAGAGLSNKYASTPWIIKNPAAVAVTNEDSIGNGTFGTLYGATFCGKPVVYERLEYVDRYGYKNHLLDEACAKLVRLNSNCDCLIRFYGVTLDSTGEWINGVVRERGRPFLSVYSLPLDRLTWIACMYDIWCALEVLEKHKIQDLFEISTKYLLVGENGRVKLGVIADSTTFRDDFGGESRERREYPDTYTAACVAVELALGELPPTTGDAEGNAKRRAQAMDLFDINFHWMRFPLETCWDGVAPSTMSPRVLRQATLSLPDLLLDAQRRVLNASDENGVGARLVNALLSEATVRTNDAPHVFNGDDSLILAADFATSHRATWGGMQLVGSLFQSENEYGRARMESVAKELYQLQDHRWQRVVGFSREPGGLCTFSVQPLSDELMKPLTAWRWDEQPGASTAEKISALFEIAQSLLGAHLAGIQHGQLTPANVFVVAGSVYLVGKQETSGTLVEEDIYCWGKLGQHLFGPHPPSPAFGALFQRAVDHKISMRDIVRTMVLLLIELESGSQPAGSTTVAYVEAEAVPVLESPLTSDQPVSPGTDPINNETPLVPSPPREEPQQEGATLDDPLRVLVEVVLPSLMEARPAWTTAGVQWAAIATDILILVMKSNYSDCSALLRVHAEQLLQAHIGAHAAARVKDFCRELLLFCETTLDTLIVREIVTCLIVTAERCLALQLPHVATHLAGHISAFCSTRDTTPLEQVERIMRLVQQSVAASERTVLEDEQKLYAAWDRVVLMGVPAAKSKQIVRDMAFASYSLIGGTRSDFSWLNVCQLELEFLLPSLSLSDLLDQISVVLQRPHRQPAFLDACRQGAQALARAGYFAAAAQFIYAALNVLPTDRDLLAQYVDFLLAAEAGYDHSARLLSRIPYAPVQGRRTLAEVRETVRQGLVGDALALQRTFTLTAVDIVRSLAEEAMAALGPAPCRVAFLGLGSMAHGAMSLFSDLEFAMVTSEPFQPAGPTRDYVTRLVRLFELKVIALGETPPMANVHHVQGLSFDSGGNTPLMKDPPLAGTAEELTAQLKNDATSGGDLIIIGVLSAPCFIAGDVELFANFEQARASVLGSRDTMSPRVWHGLRLLEESLAFRLTDGFRSDQSFDGKKALYRMPSMALAGMMLLGEIERTPAPMPLNDVIERLMARGMLHPDIARAMRAALTLAAGVRLGAHAFYRTENDTVVGKSAAGFTAGRKEVDRAIYEALIPLGACLADYVARLRDVVRRRSQGASVELENCLDTTRFFAATVQAKIALISRVDGFAAGMMALQQRVGAITDPTALVDTSVRDFIVAHPHPAVFAKEKPSGFLEGIMRQRMRIAEMLTKLKTTTTRAQLAVSDDLTMILKTLDGCYEEAASEYATVDAEGQAVLEAVPTHIMCCISGVRTLRSNVGSSLFAADGSFINTVSTGQHDVNHRVPGLHFKRNPSFPSVEYAVSLLGYMLDVANVGRLSPATDILRAATPTAQGYLYHTLVASQTVDGTPLHKALAARPDVLSRWRAEHFSMAFLLALLICPEDGKPDNFIVVDNVNADGETVSVDVVSIDNDHSFVAPFTPAGFFSKERLFIKTIIFCCDQMLQPVDARVREAVRRINPAELLRYWLQALCRSNAALATMFTPEEIEAALRRGEEGGVCLPFVMSTPVIRELYERLSRMIARLDDDGEGGEEAITHLDLLTVVAGKKVANAYGGELKIAGKSPLARFLDLTKGSYTPSRGGAQTLTTSAFMLSSNLLTKESDIKVLSPAYTPEVALESLRLIHGVREAELVEEAARELEQGRKEAFLRLAVVALQERAMRRTSWDKAVSARMEIEDSLAWIGGVFVAVRDNIRHLSLLGCAADMALYNVLTLLPTFNLELITTMDLSGSVFVGGWEPLPARCLVLRKLVLRGCVCRDPLRLTDVTEFPSLTFLDVTDLHVQRSGRIIDLPNPNVKVLATGIGGHNPEPWKERKRRSFTFYTLLRVERVIGYRVDKMPWKPPREPAANFSLSGVPNLEDRIEYLSRLLVSAVVDDSSEALERLSYCNPELGSLKTSVLESVLQNLIGWCASKNDDMTPAGRLVRKGLPALTAVVWSLGQTTGSVAWVNYRLQLKTGLKRAEIPFNPFHLRLLDNWVPPARGARDQARPTFDALFDIMNEAFYGGMTELRGKAFKHEDEWRPL